MKTIVLVTALTISAGKLTSNAIEIGKCTVAAVNFLRKHPFHPFVHPKDTGHKAAKGVHQVYSKTK